MAKPQRNPTKPKPKPRQKQKQPPAPPPVRVGGPNYIGPKVNFHLPQELVGELLKAQGTSNLSEAIRQTLRKGLRYGLLRGLLNEALDACWEPDKTKREREERRIYAALNELVES